MLLSRLCHDTGADQPAVRQFARGPDGDLDVSMQREVSEVEATTVLGDTIADRTLQRDTLACLAQRDLSEAGPERAAARRAGRPSAT